MVWKGAQKGAQRCCKGVSVQILNTPFCKQWSVWWAHHFWWHLDYNFIDTLKIHTILIIGKKSWTSNLETCTFLIQNSCRAVRSFLQNVLKCVLKIEPEKRINIFNANFWLFLTLNERLAGQKVSWLQVPECTWNVVKMAATMCSKRKRMLLRIGNVSGRC